MDYVFFMHTDAVRKYAAELPASGARIRLHTDAARKYAARKVENPHFMVYSIKQAIDYKRNPR